MEAVTEVRLILERAKPIRTPVGYKPPARIRDYKRRFYGFCRLPETSIYDDDDWFNKHWEWLGPVRSDGQMIICCYGTQVAAQNFSWLMTNGPIDVEFPDSISPCARVYPRPICGDELCVSPHHLRLKPRKTPAPHGLIEARDVDDIRWFFTHPDGPTSARRLAERYGVSERRIYAILKA